MPGGFTRVNVNQQDVKQAAHFAVGALKTTLSVTSVDLLVIRKAFVQIVAGRNFIMSLEVSVDHQTLPTNYDVVVYQNLHNNYSLTSSEQVPAPPVCPACPAFAIIENSEACFGGPMNSCRCCTETGEVVDSQYKVCPVPPNKGPCIVFDSQSKCEMYLMNCQAKTVKPWLCGVCSPEPM